MTSILSYFKSSPVTFVTVLCMAVIAFGMLVSVPSARAESPNILVGQNMTIGSTGQDVVVLQGLMSELGYLNIPAGIAFGYYGGMTRDAVSRYQASVNVAPTAGYYGPVTKIAMHNHFSQHNWLRILGW